MEDFIYYTMLFDVYQELLSKKQQTYFKEYYFYNLSLQEIAINYQVSRNAIHKQLKEAIAKLENFEEKLQIVKKNKELEEIISMIKDPKITKKLKSILEI